MLQVRWKPGHHFLCPFSGRRLCCRGWGPVHWNRALVTPAMRAGSWVAGTPAVLSPRCSDTRIRCVRAWEWTDTLLKHTVRTTTTTTTPPPPPPERLRQVCVIFLLALSHGARGQPPGPERRQGARLTTPHGDRRPCLLKRGRRPRRRWPGRWVWQPRSVTWLSGLFSSRCRRFVAPTA